MKIEFLVYRDFCLNLNLRLFHLPTKIICTGFNAPLGSQSQSEITSYSYR